MVIMDAIKSPSSSRVSFGMTPGPDGKSLFTVDGHPVVEFKEKDAINMNGYVNTRVDEELNVDVNFVRDGENNFVDYHYTFKDLYREIKISINNCEIQSKYIKNDVLHYYSDLGNDIIIWCITYFMSKSRETKIYISTTMLAVDMLIELTRYSKYNNNILLKDMYDNFIKCNQNYYFKPRFKIFLSHSSKDKTIVSDIYILLKNMGYDLFYDIDFIQGVTTLVQNIKLALRQSTVILVLISPDSVSSKWVKAEHDEMTTKYKMYLSYGCDYNKAKDLGIDTTKYHIRRIDMYNPFKLANKIDDWLKNIDVLDV